MFAKLSMALTVRLILIAVILFNALTPTFASAKSSFPNDLVGFVQNQIVGKGDKVSLAENNYRQRFARPTTNGQSK